MGWTVSCYCCPQSRGGLLCERQETAPSDVGDWLLGASSLHRRGPPPAARESVLACYLYHHQNFHRGLKEIDVSGNYRVKQENFVVIDKLIFYGQLPLAIGIRLSAQGHCGGDVSVGGALLDSRLVG